MLLSPRPVRHVPRQALQLNRQAGTYDLVVMPGAGHVSLDVGWMKDLEADNRFMSVEMTCIKIECRNFPQMDWMVELFGGGISSPRPTAESEN
jgi:hypothetical protein